MLRLLNVMFGDSYERFFSNAESLKSWYEQRKIFIDGLGVKRIIARLI